jgi:hypothetical protein
MGLEEEGGLGVDADGAADHAVVGAVAGIAEDPVGLGVCVLAGDAGPQRALRWEWPAWVRGAGYFRKLRSIVFSTGMACGM